ncbi:acetylxylan esterase [Micromonospora sp. C28SCA-DRY-2]|uniref:acetylxylan esterase n=1 Tax=Micromonospora sp. C28SCA-DRY-2 TaxID=3059522 RepID=UPI00267644D5|nr:acetylxylan esterase [Micromonospora sp. C28SCA-DRY-2]MDO3702779.1 acetylxylan esterase [Micromonospora sp. C28SCA-DRY-2]
MPLTDLTLADCWAYRPELDVPADLDAFWARTLDAGEPGPAAYRPVDTGLTQVRTFDVTVPGYGGEPVRGWLHLPAHADRPLPGVVEYLGYGRGRGLPHEKLFWAAAGYAHLIMDSRGQGWSAAAGGTADPHPCPAGTVPGFLTRGVTDPDTFYYRRLITDAVRFARAAREHPAVDPGRVAVTGVSQGGGLALAVAALDPGVAAAMPDVPFLCDIRRGVRVASRGPYGEITEYLRLHRDSADQVFRTLSYVDAAVLAPRAGAPALFSVAMLDQVCPPSTCFAAYHRYGGEKELRVYEFNDHEGGEADHQRAQLAWLSTVFGREPVGRRLVGAQRRQP